MYEGLSDFTAKQTNSPLGSIRQSTGSRSRGGIHALPSGGGTLLACSVCAWGLSVQERQGLSGGSKQGGVGAIEELEHLSCVERLRARSVLPAERELGGS